MASNLCLEDHTQSVESMAGQGIILRQPMNDLASESIDLAEVGTGSNVQVEQDCRPELRWKSFQAAQIANGSV